MVWSWGGVIDVGVMVGVVCEVGCPMYLIIDQESSFLKAFKEVEIEFFDLQHRLFKEKGIICEVSPVSAHNYSGLIERKIRSVQETFSKMDGQARRHGREHVVLFA